MKSPSLYIIAGCNGAGKTTASFTILPDVLDCQQFVNADEIAKGLSPFHPESVSFEAGRIMLHRIEELLHDGITFAIETTLATRSYHALVSKAHKLGYLVHLLYIWLSSPQLAIKRVAQRVSEGGHNIPPDVIVRRYHHGISNLFNLFMPIVDSWTIIDNTRCRPRVVANDTLTLAPELYERIKKDGEKQSD
ncbi:MAG: zeta toxin family protein [Duncaniella sp.]|nr:zeta toxin [Bacteroides sp.]MDE5828263.1 zeta toxin family protein [Duncaniella sp.]MBD5353365.1 zeta toxin [Bacteroides sp.]MDE6812870.1 zeta toxin family protein [Duncaniella sp.]MDE6823592.1 zeta toxin family protein [Duncaniella sp.]